jgi:hypothetical protein
LFFDFTNKKMEQNLWMNKKKGLPCPPRLFALWRGWRGESLEVWRGGREVSFFFLSWLLLHLEVAEPGVEPGAQQGKEDPKGVLFIFSGGEKKSG